MKGLGLVGIHHRHERKLFSKIESEIYTDSGDDESKECGRKKKLPIHKYIFAVAVMLLLVLRFSGIVRRNNLFWSEPKSNQGTLNYRHIRGAVQNILKQDNNTQVADDNSPMNDNEDIDPDGDSHRIDSASISPDGTVIVESDSDENATVESDSDENAIVESDSDENATVKSDSDDNAHEYEYHPSIDNELDMLEKIFESAPSIDNNMDMEQCQKSPIDPSIEDTITTGWGCDVFENTFYNSKVDNPNIGTGHYRRVFSGIVEEQQVVFRQLKETHEMNERNILRHTREASIMKAVHEQIPESESHVVPILGICGSDTVTPLMETDLNEVIFEDSKPFEFHYVIELAIQAAQGLRSIHTMDNGPVAHTDIKPSAFLFDKEGKIYINDLNRCRIMERFHENNDLSPQKLRGGKFQNSSMGKPCSFMISVANGIWRAPEEYGMEWLDEKLDIYSLGMVYWVMMTRKRPDANYEETDDWKEAIISGFRPTLYQHWHPGFRDLLRNMWAPDPADRPDAATVVKHLEDISRSI